MLRRALLTGLAAYASAEVRVRALPHDLVEVVVGATTRVPQDNQTNSDRVVTTRGRWDAKWGAGGFAQGSFADGIDEEGAWNLVDPTTPLSVADLAAFRLRCPPTSAFSRLGDGVVLGARYASKREAIAIAVANGFTALDQLQPKCPALQADQLELLNLHNHKRAIHCAPPLVWDADLASEAEAAQRGL